MQTPKIIIAFAYADLPKLASLRPTYYGMMEGAVKNAKEVMPGIDVVQISNSEAQKVRGAHVLWLDVNEPLMVWRLKAHQYAHSIAEQIIFIEPDVRFKEPVIDQFDDPDFDVAITKREMEVNWKGALFSDKAPYTLGCTFSRNQEFWRQCKLECQKLEEADQNWVGDMMAMAAVVARNEYKVKLLDGPTYNHIPNALGEDFPAAKVLHFKGKRKQWLFQHATEAA